jgi:NAD(P)-dependent dehydrogenase (short-subunit alcohol dehydrogenase family)
MGKERRVAVVSGANRGIGKEIARKLSAAGLEVVVGSRDVAAGQAVAREIGGRAFPLDVTDRGSVGALAEEVGTVDVLVNNAGIAMDGFDENVARRTTQTNFFGAMHLTDALLPKMKDGARIVMVSSGMGELSGIGEPPRRKLAEPELTREELCRLVDGFVLSVQNGTHEAHGWPSSAYRVSKAALNALVRVLARELEGDPRRIRVNAACPGWVATRMGGRAAPRSPEEGADTPVWLALEAPPDQTGLFFRDRRVIPF